MDDFSTSVDDLVEGEGEGGGEAGDEREVEAAIIIIHTSVSKKAAHGRIEEEEKGTTIEEEEGTITHSLPRVNPSWSHLIHHHHC